MNPLFSGVELEPGGEDDGRLQVFEILGLPFGADLVTLSACDTALGAGELSDLPAGEELVGLTRAFLSAGSRNVVASLWDVSDQATSPLMTAFYRAARAGRSRKRWHPSSVSARMEGAPRRIRGTGRRLRSPKDGKVVRIRFGRVRKYP